MTHVPKPPALTAMQVGQFFDDISQGYDASIFRGCPVYGDMLTHLMDHLWLDPTAEWTILELGCGTGNLSCLLAHRFPQSHFTLVDLSSEMLALASDKITRLTTRFETIQADFNTLAFDANRFDLVISSLAIHHLYDEDKVKLYRHIFDWLKPGGRFRCADQCKTLPAHLGPIQNQERWLSWARENGAQEEEMALWMEHAKTSDHHAALADHFQWLSDSGFQEIDCYWRTLYWTIYGSEKPL